MRTHAVEYDGKKKRTSTGGARGTRDGRAALTVCASSGAEPDILTTLVVEGDGTRGLSVRDGKERRQSCHDGSVSPGRHDEDRRVGDRETTG